MALSWQLPFSSILKYIIVSLGAVSVLMNGVASYDNSRSGTEHPSLLRDSPEGQVSCSSMISVMARNSVVGLPVRLQYLTTPVLCCSCLWVRGRTRRTKSTSHATVPFSLLPVIRTIPSERVVVTGAKRVQLCRRNVEWGSFFYRS